MPTAVAGNTKSDHQNDTVAMEEIMAALKTLKSDFQSFAERYGMLEAKYTRAKQQVWHTFT